MRRRLLAITLASYLAAWGSTAVFGRPLAHRVAEHDYGRLVEWKAWTPAPFVVRADYRYEHLLGSGAGTWTFAWVPSWCREVADEPNWWA